MVDQAQITPTNGRTETNGRELPPRAVARNTAEFLHDVATLAELQGKLAVVDLREGLGKLLWPAVLIGVGAAVILGCVPIALITLAMTLDHFTELAPFVCYLIALGVGIVIGAALIGGSLGAFKLGFRMFDRSLDEWRRNRQWAKETLMRLGRTSRSPPPSPSPGRW